MATACEHLDQKEYCRKMCMVCYGRWKKLRPGIKGLKGIEEILNAFKHY